MEPNETMDAAPVDLHSLTKEQLITVNDQLQEGMKIAQHQIDTLSKQMTDQINRYNNDVKFMQDIQSNTVKYSREKEFNLMKIIEGTLGMMNIDKMPIAPERGEDNND